MRPVTLLGKPAGNAPVDAQIRWLMDAVSKLADASRQEGSTLADGYALTLQPTPNRTLDATAATLAQVRGVLATFLADMQRRGPNQPAS